MTVIPVGPTLVQRDAIGERLTWHDAAEAQRRNPVHVGWGADTVPVNRARHRERVPDVQHDSVTLAPA